MKKFIIRLILFMLTCVFIFVGVSYRLSNVRRSVRYDEFYPVKRWVEFDDSEKDTVDLLFLGSSHCYRSLNPFIFDSILNINSYNLGSSAQQLETSFNVLEKATDNKVITSVLLEVFPGAFIKSDERRDVFDQFDATSDIRYKKRLLSGLNWTHKIHALNIPVRLNADMKYLFSNDTIANTENEYYYKGYVGRRSKSKNDKNDEETDDEIDLTEIDSCQFKYLVGLIELCERKGINLTLFTQPIMPSVYNKIKNFESFEEMVLQTTRPKGITYLNFNKKMRKLTDDDFYDAGHLTYNGGRKFSLFVINRLFLNGIHN